MVLQKTLAMLAKNESLNTLSKNYGDALGLKNYSGGTSINEALQTAASLPTVSLALANAPVLTAQEALATKAQLEHSIIAADEKDIEAVIAIDPIQLGLHIDIDSCYDVLHDITALAQQHNQFITVLTARYADVQTIISMVEQLQQSFDNINTVIQANLYRSQEDVENFKHTSVVLTKNLAAETAAVAFIDKMDIDLNLIELIKTHLPNSYTMIATNDKNIIAFTKQFAKNNGIAPQRFEFIMHYGQHTELQQTLINEGYQVRIHLPFGTHRYSYFMNKAAAKPANLAVLPPKVVTKKTTIAFGAVTAALVLRKLLKKKS